MVLLTKTQLNEIQRRLGLIFKRPELLEEALVHRSYLNEISREIEIKNNERLEFLGDAALELAVTNFLFQRLTDAPEGKLTAIRASMVCGETLAEVAEELQLDRMLFMAKGQRKDFENHSRSRSLMMASAFEAVIGAVYLDRGLGTVELFLEDRLFSKLRDIIAKQSYIDPKSYLQELTQENWKQTPHYVVHSESGPDHGKSFTIAVMCGEQSIGLGTGPSKSVAETEAAKDALQKQFQIDLTAQ